MDKCKNFLSNKLKQKVLKLNPKLGLRKRNLKDFPSLLYKREEN